MPPSDDDEPLPVSLTVADCLLLSNEILELHPRGAARSAPQLAHLYWALERPGGESMEVMLDPAYASGSLLRAEDALTAVVIRNVHRAAGHTAELLRERPDPDHEYDEETEPVYYVVTSQSAAPSTAFQE